MLAALIITSFDFWASTMLCFNSSSSRETCGKTCLHFLQASRRRVKWERNAPGHTPIDSQWLKNVLLELFSFQLCLFFFHKMMNPIKTFALHELTVTILFLTDWRHMRRENTIEISSIYWNVLLWIFSHCIWMNEWMNEWMKVSFLLEKSKSAYIQKWKKYKPCIKTDQIRAKIFKKYK